MDDAFVVGELERLADLRDDGQRLLGREPAGLLDLPQVPAVHEFHDQVMQRAAGAWAARRGDLAEVMHGDDVGMVQARQGAGFAVEPLGKARVAGGGGRQDLQRHQAVQAGLARLIDGAHAALADELKDFELGKQLGEFRDRRRHKARAPWGPRLPGRCPCSGPPSSGTPGRGPGARPAAAVCGSSGKCVPFP